MVISLALCQHLHMEMRLVTSGLKGKATLALMGWSELEIEYSGTACLGCQALFAIAYLQCCSGLSGAAWFEVGKTCKIECHACSRVCNKTLVLHKELMIGCVSRIIMEMSMLVLFLLVAVGATTKGNCKNCRE